MKKNTSNYIWGGLLILLGILFAGRATNIFTFDIFFDGWWSLFIIVPCFISLCGNNHDKFGSIVGLCIGILLLLSAQDFIQWRMFGPLVLAFILILVGGKMILPKKEIKQEHFDFDDKATSQDPEYQNNSTQNDSGYQGQQGATANNYSYTYQSFGATNEQTYQKTYQGNYQSSMHGGSFACTAVLSGRDVRFDNEVFQGAMLSAVLGGIELDLRNAIIRENVVIEAKTVLGGIDIYVPNYAKVVVNCTPILGGVDNKTMTPLGADEQTITIYLNATCVLGGIDVK